MSEETFTDDQVIGAIEAWLEYGEQSLGKAHNGYFSDWGWAARCLRYHLKQLREKQLKEPHAAVE
jgi:hypothetical protein